MPEGGTATKSARKDGEVDPRTFTPTGRLKDRQRFRDYEVLLYQPRLGDGSFEVRRGGRRIYARISEGGKFLIGELFESDTPKERIAIGKDITGRGVPNLVVVEWTGGAHCCFSAHVFELGEDFRKIASLEAGHGKLDFQDLDGDGSLEAITHDWSFAYWPRSFAESPAPRVILRFRDGLYQLAPDLMRKPPLPAGDLTAKARMVREAAKWEPDEPPPPDLYVPLLDLTYAGNARQAWEFFDMAWGPGIPGKDAFRQDLQTRLARSPYWPGVKAMNGL